MTKDTATLDPVDVAIGARIRTRREAARMTQAELAGHARVTFQQIQKYERGQNRVAAARLLQIAEALRTTGADLLGELEDGGPDGLALATPAPPPSCRPSARSTAPTPATPSWRSSSRWHTLTRLRALATRSKRQTPSAAR